MLVNKEAISGGRFRVLSEEQLDMIHLSSLEILERTGMIVHDQEAIELLQRAGAYVSGNRVRIPADVVEKAIASAPSKITFCGAKGDRAMQLYRNNVYYGLGTDLPAFIDPYKGNIRQTVLKDIEMVNVLHPELDPGVGYVTLVLEALPVGVRALFVVALIGSAISALDSYLLCGGTIFAYDIYGRLNEKASQSQLLLLTRISVVVLGLIALIVAFRFTVAMDLFLNVASVWAAGGVIPITGALLYRGKKTPAGGMMSMLSGILSYLYLYNFPVAGLEDPLPLCFAASFVFYVIGNRIGQPITTQELFDDQGTTLYSGMGQDSGGSLESSSLKENKEIPKDKIEWLGMDGLLVAGYFVLVVIMFCSLKYRIDVLTGWVFPIALLLIVLFVTLSYAKSMGSFIKNQNKKIKESKAR